MLLPETGSSKKSIILLVGLDTLTFIEFLQTVFVKFWTYFSTPIQIVSATFGRMLS